MPSSALARQPRITGLLFRRVLKRLALIVFLLVVQQAGYSHALSHFDHRSRVPHDTQLPHSKACGECGLYAELGTTLTSTSSFLATTTTPVCRSAPIAHSLHVFTPCWFLSRAPPPAL